MGAVALVLDGGTLIGPVPPDAGLAGHSGLQESGFASSWAESGVRRGSRPRRRNACLGVDGSTCGCGQDCLGYRQITTYVERTADHAVNIAKAILDMKPIPQALAVKIIDMHTFALSILDAIHSLFSNDYNEAEKTLTQRETLETYEQHIIKTMTTTKLDSNTVAGLRLILESIRRLAKYGVDIAEIVLNLTAEGIGIHEA